MKRIVKFVIVMMLLVAGSAYSENTGGPSDGGSGTRTGPVSPPRG